jgi:hypothetical protein
MADILKVYTAEQLFIMFRNKVLADNVGLTDFNAGSKNKALLESNSEIISSISMDHKEAIFKAIAVALYEGFGFSKLGATKSTGFLRPYRKPALYIKYTGSGTSAKVSSTLTNISSAVTGAPSDAFNLAYATYPTIGALVSAIDALTNWSATLVKDTSIASSTLYQYTSKEAIGATNYLNATGLDFMLNTATAIPVATGYLVSVNQQSFTTTADGTIAAGESSAVIAAEATIKGTAGDISAKAIDTINGKGYINSVIDGIEYVINDSAFSGGTAAETDDARKTRFSETVNALNAGTKNGIIVALKGITGVRSVGMRTSYPFKGNNTIVVDDGSGTISASLQASVEKVLYGDANDLINFPGKNAEGIGYNIVAPTIQAVSIGVTVSRLPNVNVDLTEIQTDVQTAIEQYVNTRALGEDVLLSEIVRVGKNSNAAVYDLVVNSPASNVSIDENEFAKTGSGTGASVSVTVVIATSI